MKLAFINRRLEKSVASFSAIATNYGTRAKLVNLRKNDLESATSLDTMRTLGGNCHELIGARKGQLTVDLSGNHR